MASAMSECVPTAEDSVLGGIVVDLLGDRHSTHPPGLDVDVAAGTERNGSLGVFQTLDQLVQTQRCVDPLLQQRVLVGIVKT
eukprot:CAMPEP_0178932010 /NCGR_PEP_ID=MMETSP0786-20121207/22304_1 /TAXON_ID=186022 /ORGANISM="Thalassionema frauenfeldii, Strain CCMP 1798" /LENGTH=81 /DNA_ID=CAMNT_0020609103 /DNA_START=82 /DNA_END=327 /DNA_ORIENTATION=+